ncbi:MAG: heavy metal translocating P-type ATPase [bacterium]|nr:heavy metal translocating P-type ATPase [bacterium]
MSETNPKVVNETLCTHCGTPVPEQLLRPGPSEQFCCNGCATVYGILHGCDLEEYYRLRKELSDDVKRPAKVTGKDYSGFDDPAFLSQTARKLPGGLLEIELYVEGTHCIACAWLIEKILLEREHARSARLDLGRSVVLIVFDPVAQKLSDFAHALDRIGYPPHPLSDNATTSLRDTDRKLLIRMGVAAAGAGNIMLLAFALYAGEFSGIEPQYASLFRWISLGLALPVVTYAAYPFYLGAWNGLRNKVAAMDLPIALGILVSFFASTIATWQQRSEVYFDSVTSLVFLLLVGRYVLARANRWASEASVTLLSAMPKIVHGIENNGTVDKPLTEVHTGDKLQILPGETIPVDGELLTDEALISEASFTGEAKPRKVIRGEVIFAGNIVVERPVQLRAVAIGEATRLGKLSQMMREAAAKRAPFTVITDRIAGWFVSSIILLATLTIVLWWQIDPTKALWYGVAMLVVTCPCALGLAVPISFATAIGFAAKQGIFIRGAPILERLAAIDRVMLDKTGTLTEGATRLLSTRYFSDLTQADQEKITQAVAAIEAHSTHHLAAAFQRTAATTLAVSQVQQIAGHGIRGVVQFPDSNAQSFVIGTYPFVAGGRHPTDAMNAAMQELDALGATPVWVSRDEEIVALYAIGDALRSDAKTAIEDIHRQNITCEILSGDSFAAVKKVSDQLAIGNYNASVSPEAKLERVQAVMSKNAVVAMVGDGVNDAAALAAADVGISPAGSAEVSREAAGVFLIEPGIGQVAALLRLAKQAMHRIRWNLTISIAYNLVGATLAITGHVTPLVAAILMPLSSLTALYLATRKGFVWK